MEDFEKMLKLAEVVSENWEKANANSSHEGSSDAAISAAKHLHENDGEYSKEAAEAYDQWAHHYARIHEMTKKRLEEKGFDPKDGKIRGEDLYNYFLDTCQGVWVLENFETRAMTREGFENPGDLSTTTKEKGLKVYDKEGLEVRQAAEKVIEKQKYFRRASEENQDEYAKELEEAREELEDICNKFLEE